MTCVFKSKNLNELSWPPMIIESNVLLDKYKCSFCKKLLVNTHQADDCGCRFCFECLDKIHKEKKANCPSCHFYFATSVGIILFFV